MKTTGFITSILLLLFTISITAQNGVNYKAIIKDSNGNVITNQTITVQFSILQGAAQTNVYQETHTPTTDVNGIIIINIGEGTIDSGDFTAIDWAADTHFLNTQINTGNGLTDLGTTQFKTVPYALSAGNAATKIDDLSDGKSDNDGTQDGSSIFIGIDAGLNDSGTDNQNVGIGFNALKNNNFGNSNVAIGYQSLDINTNGSNNTAIGRGTLKINQLGNLNTAIGTVALENNISSSNTAIGAEALWSNINGYNNTATGAEALILNTTGSNNTVNGFGAGLNNIDGSGNIFLGYKSGYNELGSNKLYIENSLADADNALIYGEFDTNILRTNSEFQIGNPSLTGYSFPTTDGASNQLLKTDGTGTLSWSNNIQSINDLTDGKSNANGASIFLGVDSGLNDNGTGSNVGLGLRALNKNVSGSLNTAIGYQSLYNNVGSQNTAIGNSALENNTNGQYNTTTGYGALSSNEIGDFNSSFGSGSLRGNVDGDNNTAIGYLTLYSNLASDNTAIGSKALYANSTGIENTAVGTYSLRNNNGRRNTAVGFNSLNTNTSGEFNTAVGAAALQNNNGDYNTAVGRSALRVNTTGRRNTATGYAALEFSTGDNNTAFGRSALSSVTTGSNNTSIGYNAQVPSATLSNQVRIGNTSVTYAGVQVAWTVTSDRRWKDQIRELPYGLDMVMQLKPVDYIRKNNEAKTREIGFIAQDVEALLTKIGYDDQGLLSKDDEGNLSLRYNDFIPLLTKALQEQQEIIDAQNDKINSLNSELTASNKEQETIEARLARLENILNTSQQ